MPSLPATSTLERNPNDRADDSWQAEGLTHCACASTCAGRCVIVQGDIKVPLFAVGLLISSTGNSILFKKMTNKMTKYEHSEWHSVTAAMAVTTARVICGMCHWMQPCSGAS